jgi:hypothetical protein
MLLKFGVKRAPESCQNLGQKEESNGRGKIVKIWGQDGGIMVKI